MQVTISIAKELRVRHERSTASIRHWCARAATGSSVIRVFAPRTKELLLRELINVPIEEMAHLKSRAEFELWFEQQLELVATAIAKLNKSNKRVQPGLKWGHSAKVLSLYLRDVLLHSRFFSDDVVARVKPWLFVPVDSRVINRLKELGFRTPFRQIREIATREQFYVVQNCLVAGCDPGMARVVFDDVWADRGANSPS
jgi:hypothetical protein